MASRKNPNPITPVATRLWPKIAKMDPDKCWPWTASTNEHGYGTIKEGGKKGRSVLAHRAVYEDVFGPIPDGLNVLHRCDNPPCCNPGHLWLGTQSDNARDMHEKGRWKLNKSYDGEGNPAAKLTVKEVLEIRNASEPHDQIASRYGITASNVSVIKNRKSWKHI